MPKELLFKIFEDLKNVIILLKSSVGEYVAFEPNKKYTPVELKLYDALSFRFEKSVELCLNFFRALENYQFKDSSETLRNLLLRMQKIGVITDVEEWMLIRDLRNKIAHTYAPEDLLKIYNKILEDYKIITFTINKVESHLKELR